MKSDIDWWNDVLKLSLRVLARKGEDEMLEHYWPNPLESFTNGCMIDLRVRLAVEFIKGGRIPTPGDPEEHAIYALNLATALLKEGERRGLVKPMPEDGEISAAMKRHIERNTNAGAYQMRCQNRIAQEEMKAAALAQPVQLPPGAKA